MDNLITLEVDLTVPKFINFKTSAIEEALKVNLKGSGKNKAGICFIKIKSSEGPIPHFHIESKDKKFFTCICIYEPLYFHHLSGEKELSSDQKILLDEFLEENWTKLDQTWREAYGGSTFEQFCKSRKLDINNLTKPDYTNITKSIHNN